jgi:hypothetical protein
MNIYGKFLEKVGKIDHSKEEIIPRQYYDFLCDKTKEYYKLIEQQKPIIQHDEEVVIKTTEEFFGKGVITGVFSVRNGTHTYCNLNLGKTYLMSECEKGWFDNIPKILIKSRRKIADPSTFPVDAHIQVKVDGMWKDRHFARFENGEVYFWLNGRTSKTTIYAEIASEWSLPEEGE